MARIAKKVTIEGGVRFEFTDGTTITTELDGMNEEIVQKLAIHGLSQKIGDSYAGAESVAEAISLAEGVFKNLLAGLWGAKVARGGKIVEALHRVTGKAVEECLDLWQGMDDGRQKELRKHADIKKALADMEAERAAALAEAADDDVTDLNDLFN